MSIKNDPSRQSERKNYRSHFRKQVLERADRDGIPKAAEDFGISESILCSWQENTRLEDEVMFLNQAAQNFTNGRMDTRTNTEQ